MNKQNTFLYLNDLNFTVAGYLMDLVRDSGLNLKLGLVQTAYANGNSTKYISETLVCVHKIVKKAKSDAILFLWDSSIETDFFSYILEFLSCSLIIQ